MEETNKTNEERMSYEQLMEAAKMLQQRAIVAEQKLMAINITAMRLQYLFTVLDHSTHFSPEFVDKCSKEIVGLLEVKENIEETEE